MSGHTPGPWVRQDNNIFAANRVLVAQVTWPHVPGEPVDPSRADERAANADLLRSAPDLLAALEALLHEVEEHHHGGALPAEDTARAAIALARGAS